MQARRPLSGLPLRGRPRSLCQHMRKTRWYIGQRRGATTVEFAIAAPVFLLLVFTCIEFCRLNMIRNLAQDAAYFAARECMVPGATVEEAEAVVNRMLGGLGTRGVQITVNGGAGLNDDSERVTVEVRVPIGQNAIVAPKFTKQLEFVAVSNFRTERNTASE